MTTKNLLHEEIVLVLCYVGVVIVQILWHWLLQSWYAFGQILLPIYLYRNPQTGREVEGYLDVMVPAILFGMLTGWFGRRWPIRRLLLHVVAAALILMALMPVYNLFIDAALIWWWPKTTSELAVSVLFGVIKAMVFVGFFTHLGRILSIYFHRPTTTNGH